MYKLSLLNLGAQKIQNILKVVLSKEMLVSALIAVSLDNAHFPMCVTASKINGNYSKSVFA